MSLSSSSLSIVSLGFSCQVSHQLRANRDRLRDVLGIPDLDIASSYFDYVITPQHALVDMLGRGIPPLLYRDEIDVVRDTPYWRGSRIFFPHNFRVGQSMVRTIDLEGEFERSAGKIAHLRDKFERRMASDSRMMFVVANSQTNIRQYSGGEADFLEDFAITGGFVAQLEAILRARLGDRFLGLLVAEGDWMPSEAWLGERVFRSRIRFDPSWQGPEDQWAAALEQMGSLFPGGEAVRDRPIAPAYVQAA